ncbi:molybdenum ABC transporter permease [Escherichia coli]|nr:molybdenum ABC transporter permease [Escherichia coli]
MGRRGFIGERLYDWFGLSFAFSWRGAVLAAAVMSFPLMVRAIRLALEGVDIKLEQAARTLGAGRWRVFFTITLPLTLPELLLVRYWHSLVRSVNLAQPSPLCRTFLVKRGPFLLPCIP